MPRCTNEQLAATLNAKVAAYARPSIMQTTVSREGVGDVTHCSVALDPFPSQRVVSLVGPTDGEWTASDVAAVLR